MIEPVSDTAPLREAFYKVFSSRSPFAPSGRAEFPVRALLYPTHGRYLKPRQFRALAGALRDRGEPEFYISLVEYEPERRAWEAAEDRHWRCRDLTFEEYARTDLYVESALYAADGSWGVLLSHEDHALVVCREGLWRSFESRHPRWRMGHAAFVRYWKEAEGRGVDVGWLGPFLEHLTERPAQAR